MVAKSSVAEWLFLTSHQAFELPSRFSAPPAEGLARLALDVVAHAHDGRDIVSLGVREVGPKGLQE